MKLSEYVLPRGVQAALAKKLKVSPVLVHQWSSGKRPVPAERCMDIEAATDGSVTAVELRPDVFKPKETDVKPEKTEAA
jgi:DNA-binding transcriptional regulator YdaS (Cro superfamily)